jgi:hypothetical protein
MDKKGFIGKATEPTDQFQTLAIDIMMYSKYKVKNGVSIEGLADLLRKLKISLLKIISSNEFLKALSLSS